MGSPCADRRYVSSSCFILELRCVAASTSSSAFSRAAWVTPIADNPSDPQQQKAQRSSVRASLTSDFCSFSSRSSARAASVAACCCVANSRACRLSTRATSSSLRSVTSDSLPANSMFLASKKCARDCCSRPLLADCNSDGGEPIAAPLIIDSSPAGIT